DGIRDKLVTGVQTCALPIYKPLERAVEDGLFREDLFYRLNVVTIHIPPLRERREEIPILLDFFVRKYSEYYGKNPPAFSDYAIRSEERRVGKEWKATRAAM